MSRFLFSCPSGSPCIILPHSLEQGDLPQLSWGCGVTAVTSFLGTNSSPYHWCSWWVKPLLLISPAGLGWGWEQTWKTVRLLPTA